MRAAAIAIRAYVLMLASSVGLEGLFLIVGTACLAVGASFISPAGPWFAVGVMATLAGLVLAVPPRKA